MNHPPPYQPPYGPMYSTAPPQGRPETLPFARWSRRAGARLIDIAVVTIPAAVIGLVIGLVWVGVQATAGGSGALSRNFGIIFSVALYLCLVGYDALTVSRLGRTFGKHLVKLRVTALDRPFEDARIPLRFVLVRAALFHLWVLFLWANGLLILGLGIASFVAFALWPLWDRPDRQGLHDKVARTVVLDKV